MTLRFNISQLRAGAALLSLSIATTPALHAAIDKDKDVTQPTATTFNFSAMSTPVRDFRYQPEGVSSSLPDNAVAADPAASLTLDAGAGQPPPGRRRSYGRSRYEDRMHNSDGSTKIAFVAGAGMVLPVGNTGKYYTPGFDVLVGAGLNFSKMFGILGEFRYDHMGVTGGAINTEFNNLVAYLQPYGYTAANLAGFDANSHMLSITVDPVVSFASDRSKLGAYVTGGVDFYKKTTNFTLPAAQTGCNNYYCSTYYTNYNFDTASANSFGTNAGFGLTYKISEFSTERLFIEARYNWLKINSMPNNDFFIYNRRNSEYVPMTVGIRF